MEELQPIPESISHKILNAFMSNAKKELETLKEYEAMRKEDDTEVLLLSLENISKEVIQKLNKSEIEFSKDKSPKALMALGAMEVHLNLAVQALKAYKKE